MMRNLLAKKRACGLVIAATAAWLSGIPAFATQASTKSSSGTTHKRTAHRTTRSGSTTANTHSTSAAKMEATKTSTIKSATGSSSRKKARTKKVKGQQAPTPDRISQIQEALASKGAFAGTPTGAWDDETVGAVKKFQSSNGLTPTGKLDALTLQKLWLGSETAGVAPPIVPPDSENRLRSSSTPASSSAEPR